jgi:hypothetical protein
MDAKSPPTRADEARVNKDVIMPYMTTIKTPASAEDSVAALMKEIETNARHPLTSSSDVPYKSSMTGSRQALAIEPSDIFTVDTVSDDNRNISIAEREELAEQQQHEFEESLRDFVDEVSEPVAPMLPSADVAEASNRLVTPGAIRVAGMNQAPGDNSEQSLLWNYDNEGNTNESTTELTRESSRVVAKVVDEEQLLQELLFRRPADVVQAENIATVVGEPMLDHPDITKSPDDGDDHDGAKGEEERNRQLRRNATRRWIATVSVFVAVIIVIAIVLTAVFVSKSNQQSKQIAPTLVQKPSTVPSSSPSIAKRPTTAPVPRLEAFRSVLLNNSISSIHLLNQPGSAQYEALNWLANDDEAMLVPTAPLESIINRYVLAVIYFGNSGTKWTNGSNFLSPGSICSWHNAVNGTGAFCNGMLAMEHY